MAQPGIQLGVMGRICPRCSQPEDLLPIQQAVVVRSFPRRYAASIGAPAPTGPPVRAQARSGGGAGSDWSPLERLAYVSAMLAATNIRLSELLGHKGLDRAHPVAGTYRPCGNPEVEAALARLDDQAEYLGQTHTFRSSDPDRRRARGPIAPPSTVETGDVHPQRASRRRYPPWRIKRL